MREEMVASLIQGMRALGLQAEGYLARAAVESEGRVPEELLARFWHHAISEVRDDTLPARVGLAVPIGTFGLLDYLAASSPTLESALVAVSRHLLAVTDSGSYRFESPIMSVTHRHSAPQPQTLFMVALLISRTRTVVGTETIARIDLPAREVLPLQQIFGVDVHGGAPEARVHFRPDHLTSPLRDSNQGLHEVLLKTGAALGFDQPVTSLSARVRARLPGMFRGHRPTVDELARSLGFSRRDFTRKLASEGCTLSELLDRWAESRAVALLHSGASISDVACELGYADQAAFTRAFRRWTGVPPGSAARNARGLRG